jgi:hypothetical protein
MRHEEKARAPARVRKSRRRFFVGVLLGVLAPLAACGTNAIGVGICDDIETAQCTRATQLACAPEPDAGFNLANPPHPDDNLEACIEFYKVACLHGLVTPVLPSSQQVTSCVDFINHAKQCSVVAQPQTADACAWLIPPEASTADVADAAREADSDAAHAADADGGTDAADADAHAGG